MDDVQDDLLLRRERGRRAQANFRQRQAQASRVLRERDRRLKDAIEKLVHMTSGDERPELLHAITDVAKAAGINGQNSAQEGRPQVEPVSPEKGAQLNRGGGCSRQEISVDVATKDVTYMASHQSRYRPRSTPLIAASQQRRERPHTGIWLDPLRYMRISVPPEDIIPYLGGGSESFAGRIFWAIMEHTKSDCKCIQQDDLAILMQEATLHSEALTGIDHRYIQSMVDARLEYKHVGSMSSAHAMAAETDLGLIVRDRINEEYRANGKDPSLWLTCFAVEQRVRRLVSGATFRLLATAAGGEGGPVQSELMKAIVCRLFRNCICFGDGPRWHVDVIDRLFLELAQIAAVNAFLIESEQAEKLR